MTIRAKAGGRRGTNGPVRIDRLAKDCLGSAIARYGFGSAEIIARWPEIVGPELAGCTRPERVRWPRRRDEAAGGDDAATLVIRAEGGDALDIQHMSGSILERVNAFFGWRAVSRIAIRQAPLDKTAQRSSDLPARRAARSGACLTATDAVEDEALRAAFDRLGRQIAAIADKTA